MKKIRNRVRADRKVSEKRKTPKPIGRWAYLTLLTAFAIGLIDYGFGDLVFLRADGVIHRDKIAIEAAFPAQVTSVNVTPGQTVIAGQELMSINSVNLRMQIAQLTLQNLSLHENQSRIQARLAFLKNQLPLIKSQVERQTKRLKKLKSLAKEKLINENKIEEHYQGADDLYKTYHQMQSEQQLLIEQKEQFQRKMVISEETLKNLSLAFDNGKIIAPKGGDVGVNVRSTGEVLTQGEPFLEIYTGNPYVLAYLPDRYLLKIKSGMEVNVRVGNQTVIGHFDKVLSISDALPKEFHNTIRAVGRNQLARIYLSKPTAFPMHQRVHITKKGIGSTLLSYVSPSRVFAKPNKAQ